jgi:WD40 repeat protein
LVWPEIRDEDLPLRLLTAFQMASDVRSVAISPDGRCLAAMTRDMPFDLWNRDLYENWDPVAVSPRRARDVRSLAFSPRDKVLASGYEDGRISIWNMDSDFEDESLDGGDDLILSVGFSPEGTLLATVGADSRVLLWDLVEKTVAVELTGHSNQVKSVTFSPDGLKVASAGEDSEVRIWDIQRPGQPLVLRGHSGIVLAVAFSADGKFLASSSVREQGCRIWDVATGESRGRLGDDEATSIATCLAFAPYGWSLLVGNDHGDVSLWNLASRRVKGSSRLHQGWVKTMVLNPTGRVLVTGGNDGFVKVWDTFETFRD